MALVSTVTLAADPLTAVVGAIHDDQLTEPTPCDDYDVGALIGHLLHWAPTLAGAAHKREVAPPDVPLALPLAWQGDLFGHVDRVVTAWREPHAWEGTTRLGGIELPAATVGAFAVRELVVHGWDLARATGQPFVLPEATLRTCLDHVAAFVPNAPVPGLWGPPVAVAADAGLLDRIVAITGRTP
jgi:uncharacterized protein (TIGR03086 family)